MNSPVEPAPAQVPPPLARPQFHDESGALRFWVALEGGGQIGASITARALHYRFQGQLNGADALATYNAHRSEIDAAVRRRVAAGSIEPVMLREHDLTAAPR